MPGYGDRRLTRERQRRGVAVNDKRVLRLMREDNLLCLRQWRFVRTTDSAHALAVSPNLVPELRGDGLDQLWIAAMTDVRLPQAFVYLAVRLDASNRRCIGWALDRTLEAGLALTALQMALATRPIRPGAGPSLGSRNAICLAGLYQPASGPWDPDQHEPHRESF
jgi:transposase InsO family protein